MGHTELILPNTIDYWIGELTKYDAKQLLIKPSLTTWSIGQVYMHLISETSHFLKQAAICLSSDDNAHETCSADAKEMLANNSFPDELIEGPPTNARTPQPESLEQIATGLKKLQSEALKLTALAQKEPGVGKTRHPGLKFFNAREWLQFADMHLRHHIRQKKRIDEFLKRNF